MINQILKIVSKNKKVIFRAVIGGACIAGSLISIFNIDRAIKKMKLDNVEAINEYKRVLKEVEHKLAKEVLSSFERATLEKTRQHCIDKISELRSKNKTRGE